MSVRRVENIKKSNGEMDFFVYQWSVEEDNDSTLIRSYGITRDNKTVYVRIDDFTPYCYIELPSEMDWTESRIDLVSNRLSTLNQKLFQPVKRQFVYRRKLYYAWKNKRDQRDQRDQRVENDKIVKTPKYTDRQFPFLFFAFRSTAALQSFSYSMKKDIEIPGLGVMKFSLHENERGVSPVLKLQASKKLPSAGMIRVKGISIPEYERESNCEYEISCSYENLYPLESSDILEPRVISFDIEANSTITSAMPDASRPNDKVFQIGFASLLQKKRRKYLFSLGNPDHNIVGQEVELRTFKTEADLLVALTDFIREEKFNVVIGYNILGWDFQYMISRAKYTKCFTEFSLMGKLQGKSAKEVAPQFESKAFNAQKLVYLDAEGILFLDLLPIIKRSGEKLTNHRLSTVLEYFNLPSKDPLTARDIFRCYREFTPSSLGEVGKYCVQDAYATLLLYEKMQTWFGLCEMSKTAHVPIFSLFSQGTQIQMFSQVMEYCMYNNYVIISNGYTIKEGDEYMGAIVLTPVPGKYKKVISFDFASLYPSIMMSHNIDYSTLVPEGEMYLVDTYDTEEYLSHWHHFPCFTKVSYIDMFNPQNNREEWSNVRNRSELQTRVETMKEKYPHTLVCIFKDKSEIPDEDCHVFCWADHSNCKHDENRRRLKNGEFSKSKAMKVICGQRYYRFMKAEAGGKGVVPILLESLISRRRDTRAQIKKNTTEMRTLVTKLVGAVNGTSEDFKNIKDFLEEFEKREKDLFCDLEKVETQIKVDECLEIISRIESLETSNHILDKRQASYKVCANSMYGAMGVKKGYLPLLPGASSITYKGRRSIEFISTYIPEKYGGVTVYGDTDSSHIYFPHLKNNEEAVELAERIVDEIQQFFPKPMKLEFEKIYEKYIILTKKRYMTRVANKKGEIIEFIKKGVMLSRRDNCEFARKMYLKASESLLDDVPESTILTDVVDGINTLFQRSFGFKSFVITKAMARAEYKNKTLPAHVQLAYKMRARGIEVPVGARVEYIFTTRCIGEKNFAQGDKVEDLDYFSQWRQFLRVDYLYYLEKQLIKPLDELLFVGLGVKNFVNTQYNLRMCKWETLEKIKSIFSPDITFEDEHCLNHEKTEMKTIKGYPKPSVKNLKNVVKRKRLPKRAEIILDSDSDSDS